MNEWIEYFQQRKQTPSLQSPESPAVKYETNITALYNRTGVLACDVNPGTQTRYGEIHSMWVLLLVDHEKDIAHINKNPVLDQSLIVGYIRQCRGTIAYQVVRDSSTIHQRIITSRTTTDNCQGWMFQTKDDPPHYFRGVDSIEPIYVNPDPAKTKHLFPVIDPSILLFSDSDLAIRGMWQFIDQGSLHE